MAITSKLLFFGIVAFSFLAGVIAFYFLSEQPKEQKKREIDEVITALLNFVIFMIIGKVLINWRIFIDDPLAVLAYPSNSSAFYLAVLFSIVLLVYKSKYKQLHFIGFSAAFLPIFLSATFLYEFIQLVWKKNSLSLGNMLIAGLILVLYLYLRERLKSVHLVLALLTGWSAGMLILSYFQPFITIFGFIVARWFVLVFLVLSFSVMMIRNPGLKRQ
ncbi:hypothetical protein [Bacillus mesophilum]|uniref:hypothetical protein n=1 Tax=Bacillus mesophilum TaxID=1071718 RepID=UPI0018650691|nr:hypothetical protein [Bacillus mesophilum]